MTVYEFFQTKSINEIAEWFSEHWPSDGAPWTMWFDETYCQNCESEIGYYDNREMEFGYCELYGKCRFFNKHILYDSVVVEMWLESEADDETC